MFNSVEFMHNCQIHTRYMAANILSQPSAIGILNIYIYKGEICEHVMGLKLLTFGKNIY